MAASRADIMKIAQQMTTGAPDSAALCERWLGPVLDEYVRASKENAWSDGYQEGVCAGSRDTPNNPFRNDQCGPGLCSFDTDAKD